MNQINAQDDYDHWDPQTSGRQNRHQHAQKPPPNTRQKRGWRLPRLHPLMVTRIISLMLVVTLATLSGLLPLLSSTQPVTYAQTEGDDNSSDPNDEQTGLGGNSNDLSSTDNNLNTDDEIDCADNPVTILASNVATASGSGASGLPSVTLNVPTGSNSARALLVYFMAERDHIADGSHYSYGDNWVVQNGISEGVYNPYSQSNLFTFAGAGGSISHSYHSGYVYSYHHAGISPSVWYADFSTEVVGEFILEDELDALLPSGSGNVTVDFDSLSIRQPKSAQDETVLGVIAFDYVNQDSTFPDAFDSFVFGYWQGGSSTGGAYISIVDRDLDPQAEQDAALMLGFMSNQSLTDGTNFAFQTAPGFNVVMDGQVVNNSSPANAFTKASEKDGVSYSVQFRNGPASGYGDHFSVYPQSSIGDNGIQSTNYPVVRIRCVDRDEVVEPIVAPTPPPSLKTVNVPPIDDLDDYVADNSAAKVLGKALFWDMAVGSDGIACASCHYHAGADNRVKNQLTSGLLSKPSPDETFQPTASGGAGGPNYIAVLNDFPFHQFNDPNDRSSGVKFTTNDAFTSQGSFSGNFTGVPTVDELKDLCDRAPDPIFHVNGVGTRRVEPRNSPTVINAVFNFRNFWDGRANNVFNGVDPFGNRSPNATVLKNEDYGVENERVELHNASLASQAVGPPLSNFEMSCANRRFADVGRKMIERRPLAQQVVHSQDSLLSSYIHSSGIGLDTTYESLIQSAFRPKYWNASGHFNGYTQMESNFSLFFGLALQLYQSTLISDDAPYDDYQEGHDSALNDAEKRGLNLFLDKGKCINCHSGPEFTKAATKQQRENEEDGLVERMIMGNNNVALYDGGFYNIGVTPTNEDWAVGDVDPWGNPLSFTEQYVNDNFVDPIEVDPCTFEVPFDSSDCDFEPSNLSNQQVAVKGAFKTTTLRNVELTGPFMHNGSMATLEEVVEFYNRGGNFHNNPELDPDIRALELNSSEQADLVAFMKSLTDPRVRFEKAPFDHPQLFIPHGHPGNEQSINAQQGNGLARDDFEEIPAVGKNGLNAEGLPPLKTFQEALQEGPPAPDRISLPLPTMSFIQMGDVNCSGNMDSVDALAVAQFTVGMRTAHNACPLVDLAGQLNASLGDVNGNNQIDAVDSLFILQCAVGMSNSACEDEERVIRASAIDDSANSADIQHFMPIHIGGAEVSPSIATYSQDANTVLLALDAGEMNIGTGTITLNYDASNANLVNCNVESATVFCHESIPGTVNFTFIDVYGMTGNQSIANLAFDNEDVQVTGLTIFTLADNKGRVIKVAERADSSTKEQPNRQIFVPLINQ